MSKEKNMSEHVIDEKLSELYKVLTELNTLKEKTAAVQQIVDGLSEAGKARVVDIEKAVDRLGDDIKKSIEIIRNVFASSTTAAKETMEKSVADTKATLDESVAKVAQAVDAAGKARVDSMKITADTFSQTVSGLVQSANEGTARMSEIVAELRGLPLVEELHAVKTYSEKLTEEIKKVTESIAKVDGSVAEARTAVEGKVDALGKSLSDGQKSILDNLQQKLTSLDALANGIMAAIKETAQSESKKLDALSTEMATQAGDIKDQISAVEKALCTAIAEKADSLTEESEKLSAKLSEVGTKIESLTEEMKAESKVNQHKISVGTWIIGLLLGLLTIVSIPAIIVGWKTLLGS